MSLDIGNLDISAKFFSFDFRDTPLETVIGMHRWLSFTESQREFEQSHSSSSKNTLHPKNLNIDDRINALKELRSYHKFLMRFQIKELLLSLELNHNLMHIEDITRKVRELDSFKYTSDDGCPIKRYGFREIIARDITLSCQNSLILLRDYPSPLFQSEKFNINGLVILGQLNCPDAFKQYQNIFLTADDTIQMEVTKNIPLKLYHNLSVSLSETILSYGMCLEPVIKEISLAIDRLTSIDKPIHNGTLAW